MGSMTFEEAKREIERLDDCLWSEFEKNPNPKTYGEARAYEEACHILDEVDTEPVGKPDKMTLTELAHELRKIFKFRYLTVQPTFYRDPCNNINKYCGDAIELWDREPRFLSDKGFREDCFLDGGPTGRFGKEYMHPENLVAYLELGLSKTIEEMLKDGDFSEYEKCIVEVSDDID